MSLGRKLADFAWQRAPYRYLALVHRKKAVAETAHYKWRKHHHNRIEVINRIVAHLGNPCRYLEIGCQGDVCFNAVIADHKVGVDPVSGGTHRMTSDAFFAQNRETFDVIFVDGLHVFDQSRRDAINGLACLRTGGFMLLHDLLPNTWQQEHVPRLSKVWTGDVWKTGVELAATPGITYRTLKIDYGVGVLRKDAEAVHYTDLARSLKRADFADYLKARKRMKLASFDEFLAVFLPNGRTASRGPVPA